MEVIRGGRKRPHKPKGRKSPAKAYRQYLREQTHAGIGFDHLGNSTRQPKGQMWDDLRQGYNFKD